MTPWFKCSLHLVDGNRITEEWSCKTWVFEDWWCVSIDSSVSMWSELRAHICEGGKKAVIIQEPRSYSSSFSCLARLGKMMQTKHISQERKNIKLWWTWNDPHNDRKRVTASYLSLLIQTRSILLFCFRWLKTLSGCNDVCVQVRKNHSRATTVSPMK